jgi:hypothetical protein
MNEQNFSNHAKFVPLFHAFLIPVLVINLGVHIYSLFKYSMNTPYFVFVGIFSVILAVALLVLAFLARIFALGVQDRVIRLEERLRCERLLPDDLKPRIGEFNIDQLVSMRYASDAEISAVLDGKVNSRKAIKKMVQNWRADYQRV